MIPVYDFPLSVGSFKTKSKEKTKITQKLLCKEKKEKKNKEENFKTMW